MKQTDLRATSVLLLCLMLCIGCDNNDVIELQQTEEHEHGVCFTSSLTRATDTEFEVGDIASIYAIKTIGSSAPNFSVTPYAENARFIYTSDDYFIPYGDTDVIQNVSGTDSLHYYAAYPYAENLEWPIHKFVISDDYESSNVMVSRSEASALDIVPLQFYHVMARLELIIDPTGLPSGDISAKLLNVQSSTIVDFENFTAASVRDEHADIQCTPDGTLRFKVALPAQIIPGDTDFLELTIGNHTYTMRSTYDIVLKLMYQVNYTVYFDNLSDS